MSYVTCHVQLVSHVVIDVLYDYKLSYMCIHKRQILVQCVEQSSKAR
jgi:hypothetical protein